MKMNECVREYYVGPTFFRSSMIEIFCGYPKSRYTSTIHLELWKKPISHLNR
jgi:hypothetical protein